MEKFHHELTAYLKYSDTDNKTFIRRIIATLLKTPHLLENPHYKRLQEEGFRFLAWINLKPYLLNQVLNTRATVSFNEEEYFKYMQKKELDRIYLLTTVAKNYEYDFRTLKTYLNFRKSRWN